MKSSSRIDIALFITRRLKPKSKTKLKMGINGSIKRRTTSLQVQRTPRSESDDTSETIEATTVKGMYSEQGQEGAIRRQATLIPPEECIMEHWQRYEIVHEETRAKLADKLVQGKAWRHSSRNRSDVFFEPLVLKTINHKSRWSSDSGRSSRINENYDFSLRSDKDNCSNLNGGLVLSNAKTRRDRKKTTLIFTSY